MATFQRTQDHDLIDILVIVVCTLLCAVEDLAPRSRACTRRCRGCRCACAVRRPKNDPPFPETRNADLRAESLPFCIATTQRLNYGLHVFKTLKRYFALLVPDIVFWRTVQGLRVAHSTRNSPWAYAPGNQDELLECEGIGEILRALKPGVFWDAGCNLGYYSLYAAKLGWEVYSWDLGSRAIELLQMSAQRNQLRVIANQKAFTDKPVYYREMGSAYAGNQVTVDPKGSLSMTWKDAAAKYPTPTFLKMDIEGAEIDFLKNGEFREWIMEKKIVLAVEIHHPSSYYYLAQWKNAFCPNKRLIVLP